MKILILLLTLSTIASPDPSKRGEILTNIENRDCALFINRIWNDAEYVCRKYDLPLGLLIAQAAFESGWGKSSLCKNRNNYLGIKFEGKFATFKSRLHCFESWAKVVSKPCYTDLEFKTLSGWCYLLESCGYAEKGYARHIKRIVKQFRLDIIPLTLDDA